MNEKRKIEKVNNKISEVKEKLNLLLMDNTLNSNEVIQLSEKLDKLIVMHMKMRITLKS